MEIPDQQEEMLRWLHETYSPGLWRFAIGLTTAHGLGTPKSFQITGQDFIRRALYASGAAATATRLPDENGNRGLVLSYPGEDAVLELTLAPDGRILQETQTAPHHLVTRTLIYPEPESHHD